MSRNYNMTVIVGSYLPEKVNAIREAAKEEWDFDGWDEMPRSGKEPQLLGWGDDKLCAGEGEEDFVHRLAKAIWKANGACCEVEVQAVYLDDLPSEVYFPDEDEYHRLIEGEPPADRPSQG